MRFNQFVLPFLLVGVIGCAYSYPEDKAEDVEKMTETMEPSLDESFVTTEEPGEALGFKDEKDDTTKMVQKRQIGEDILLQEIVANMEDICQKQNNILNILSSLKKDETTENVPIGKGRYPIVTRDPHDPWDPVRFPPVGK